ncbi:hypothetical protein B566_EDAN016720 [Ephemera danica]|nr:hypothetical protein B566_EDAN016720 [Ephemera danica]
MAKNVPMFERNTGDDEMSKEIKRRFIPISTTDTKKNKCAALTEKTDMLSKMMSFLDLKRKSAEILDSYPQQIKLCSRDIIEQMSNPMPFKTQYKKIMKIKIYRALIDLKKDNNLCIIMKDEGDVEKFMFARDTCKYKKVEKVYIFLENLVDIPQTRLENEYFVRIEHDESEKRTRAAQELSDETTAEIDSTSVSLQGCDVKLCDVCSNWKDILDEDDICAFLKSELPKIPSKVPPKSINWDEIEKAKRERYIREKLRGSSELAYRHIVMAENEFLDDLQDTFLALHDDLGIIVNENPPIFSHRTIAEYLAAKYVVSHLFSKECNEATIEDTEEILMEDEYEVVRIFLNSLLDVQNLPPYFNDIDKNEKLVTYDDGKYNPIHVAATEGNIKLLEALLNRDKSLINHKNEKGRTALLCACKGDNEDIVRFLINQNCSKDTVDNSGNNVLHYASKNGNEEILILILHPSSNAADLKIDNNVRTLTLSNDRKMLLNMQNVEEYTPLHYAVESGKLNAVKFLIGQSDNVGTLHIAAAMNYIAIMDFLLQYDITLLNMVTDTNETALHYTCSKGNVEAAKLLLDHKCKTDIINYKGRTVLHAVCQSQTNSNEIIKLLLKHDPKLLNIKDRYGKTALHYVSKHGNVSTVQTLLDDTDCKLEILDTCGNTVLHVAAQSGCIDIIDLFLQRDKSLLYKKNERGYTPLQVACVWNKADAVQCLLNHSLPESINQNQEIKTAFRTALEEGSYEKSEEIWKVITVSDTIAVDRKKMVQISSM